MLFTVATQATGVGIFFRHRFKTNDLGHIPAAFYVRGPGTVTRLTTVSVQRGLEMSRVFEVVFVQVFMTGLTSGKSDVLVCLLLGRSAAVFLGSGEGRSKNTQQQDCYRCRSQELYTHSACFHGGTPLFATRRASGYLATLVTAAAPAGSIWSSVQLI
jgi:hypothetical protein